MALRQNPDLRKFVEPTRSSRWRWFTILLDAIEEEDHFEMAEAVEARERAIRHPLSEDEIRLNVTPEIIGEIAPTSPHGGDWADTHLIHG